MLCLRYKCLYCLSKRKHCLRQLRNNDEHHQNDNSDHCHDRKHKTQRPSQPFRQFLFFYPLISKQSFFKKTHWHVQHKSDSSAYKKWSNNAERKAYPLKQQFIVPKCNEKNDRKNDQFSHLFHIFFIQIHIFLIPDLYFYPRNRNAYSVSP